MAVRAGQTFAVAVLAVRILLGQVDEVAAIRPSASFSAVSTESVIRGLLDALTVSRSTTTSTVCGSWPFSSGTSVSGYTLPSTWTRAKPLACRSANSSAYSPAPSGFPLPSRSSGATGART